VLAANVWAGGYELDLVLRRGRRLVFCEVKAKEGKGYGEPLEMLGPEKLRRLLRAAETWLAAHPGAPRTGCSRSGKFEALLPFPSARVALLYRRVPPPLAVLRWPRPAAVKRWSRAGATPAIGVSRPLLSRQSCCRLGGSLFSKPPLDPASLIRIVMAKPLHRLGILGESLRITVVHDKTATALTLRLPVSGGVEVSEPPMPSDGRPPREFDRPRARAGGASGPQRPHAVKHDLGTSPSSVPTAERRDSPTGRTRRRTATRSRGQYASGPRLDLPPGTQRRAKFATPRADASAGTGRASVAVV